jgi:hypothetical protein
MRNLTWNKPESTPVVEHGTEEFFWIAVESRFNKDKKPKVFVFLALYQNRPLSLDEDGNPDNDDYLSDTSGEPIESVGWVENKSHYDFEDFYVPLSFNDDYKLLGWAEYVAPEFTGVGL